MTFSRVDSFRKKTLEKCVQNIDVKPEQNAIALFIKLIIKRKKIRNSSSLIFRSQFSFYLLSPFPYILSSIFLVTKLKFL
ncbi:hypothetical protein C7K43_01015 [Tetragenococcus koreensis]|nr:hypothetical protein C7K43_01015 [Tetragenococcus koreensis]